MLQTPYYPAFISAAAWSPTRAGVAWQLERMGYEGLVGSTFSEDVIYFEMFFLIKMFSFCGRLWFEHVFCDLHDFTL